MKADEIPEVKEWLSECRTASTRRTYEVRIRHFFEWYGKEFEEFKRLEAKDIRHLGLQYQSEHIDENPNSLSSVLTALSSFATYLDKPINFRGKRVKVRPDVDSHVFSNGDLTKMFDVANTKEKALLSLLASTGWEISAVLEFDRKFLTQLIARAKAEGSRFMYFPSVRKKTGVRRLGVLNPLALEWVDKWLTESAGRQPRKRKAGKFASEVFDFTPEAANKMLRRLAKDGAIISTGRVHAHRIRAWVMSGLSRAGFNEFQIKYTVGKAIPMTDMTYLKTLEEEIIERYPKAYEQLLCIKPERIVKVVDEKIEQTIRELQLRDAAKDIIIDKLQQNVKILIDELAKTMPKKEAVQTLLKRQREERSQ